METVLDHLPRVTGSEGDMDAYIIQKNGFDCGSSHTEFGEWGGYKNWKTLSTEIQSEYILVVNGSLRDRQFIQTFREFMKWIVRLGKRVGIEDVLVEIKDDVKSTIIKNHPISNSHSYSTVFEGLFEDPSWYNRKNGEHKEPNWCEFMMYDRAKDSSFPMMLAYKYFADPENDAEVERRMDYK